MTASSIGLLQLALLVGAVEVQNAELGFRFEMPDGYEATELPDENAIYAFRDSSQSEFSPFLVVDRMSEVIGRTSLPDDLKSEDGKPVELYDEKWGDFTLQVARIPHEIEGTPCIQLNVLVPLTPNAIRITVVGKRSQEAELRKLLHGVLASLEGPTNWMTTSQRVQWAARIAVPIAILLIAALLATVWWKRRRKAAADDVEDAGDTEDVEDKKPATE